MDPARGAIGRVVFGAQSVRSMTCSLTCVHLSARASLRRRFCKRTFPWTQWLPTYSFKTDLVRDVVAGVTVGVMAVPQAMSYATVAGEPSEWPFLFRMAASGR